jgi:hypothetical protein
MVVVDWSGWTAVLGIDNWLRGGAATVNTDVEVVFFVVIGTHLDEAWITPDQTRLSNKSILWLSFERLCCPGCRVPRSGTTRTDSATGKIAQGLLSIVNKT